MIKLQNADMEKKRNEIMAELKDTLPIAGGVLAASLFATPLAIVAGSGFLLPKVVKKFIPSKKEETPKQSNIVFTCSECGNVFDLSDAGIAHK